MIVEPLVCAGCGATIEATGNAPQDTCPHCGAEVPPPVTPAPAPAVPASLREAAREAERAAAEAERARLRSELERMERDWGAYCKRRGGRPGGVASGSLSASALMVLVGGILVAMLGLIVDFSVWAALPGILVFIAGIAACVRSAARDARAASEAAQRYESRRAGILKRLEAGG
jgi:hypothetical protein